MSPLALIDIARSLSDLSLYSFSLLFLGLVSEKIILFNGIRLNCSFMALLFLLFEYL